MGGADAVLQIALVRKMDLFRIVAVEDKGGRVGARFGPEIDLQLPPGVCRGGMIILR
jgi:hypothetical protein